jgi:ankyrin repeat protein
MWGSTPTPGNYQIFVSEGADVNVKDSKGVTLFLWAVAGGNLEIVELLVSQGADVNAKNGTETVLDVARRLEYMDIVKYLSSLK